MFSKLRSRMLQELLPPPVHARHGEYSMVLSLEDDPAAPSPRLLEVALAAVEAAATVDLQHVSGRIRSGPRYPDVWPGEHYRLLAGLTEVLEPRLVVELGTFTGMSALALKERLRPSGRIVTFDVVPWKAVPETLLTQEDFADGRLTQVVDDLTLADGLESHRELLHGADMIFVDAAKDGVMEQRFLDRLESVEFQRPPLLVLDDTRLWNMLATWRSISRPKLDMTSFGHWSGTGLVDWVPAVRDASHVPSEDGRVRAQPRSLA